MAQKLSLSELIEQRINRRWILVGIAILFASLAAVGFHHWQQPQWRGNKRVIVIGIDGMDPQLLRRFMAEGKMPNFSALAKQGSFRELTTSIPPLSPVAWSSVITGMDPGGHGIFDFVHRDPETMEIYLSMARVRAAKHYLKIGHWKIPLGSGSVKNLRHGKAFWQYLDDFGVPATVYRIPANFPPVPTRAHTFAGMGTPDLRGDYGTFVFYTDDPSISPRRVDGGQILSVRLNNWRARTALLGPTNTLHRGLPMTSVHFTIDVDPQQPVARLKVGDQEVVLREGEWSDWIHVDFPMVPGVESIKAICRFYLRQAHPYLKLYVSPMNIDPADPALPLSTPEDWSQSLADEMGDFYTTGFQQETNALKDGILSDEEYLKQAREVFAENKRAMEFQLQNFQRGLFFFYFSSIDLNSHVLWRTIDPKHPEHNPHQNADMANALEDFYQKMDGALGEVMKRADDNTTVIVLSDHGFGPYYRSFNLNTWLLKNGYLALRPGYTKKKGGTISEVDWSRTRAYALAAINGLYVNMKGRERHGIVDPKDADALLNEIARKLLQTMDPEKQQRAVTRVDMAADVYHGPYARSGPDAIIGFTRGYRASIRTIFGDIPPEVFEENTGVWSGDHSNDYTQVPGVLLSNKKITAEAPALTDIAPTILAEFGIDTPSQMKGTSVFAGGAMPTTAMQARTSQGR